MSFYIKIHQSNGKSIVAVCDADLIGKTISNDKINSTEDRICCLITSNPSKEGILIENKFIENGRLIFKSWIKSYRLFTIHEGIIRKKDMLF